MRWQHALQVCSYLLWSPLIVLTIDAVRRAGLRRHFLIFTYLVTTFLLAVIQIPAVLAYRSDHRQVDFMNLAHGAAEGVATTLLLSIVVGFICRAAENFSTRKGLRLVLMGAATAFMAISFAVHYESGSALSIWIVPWTRDLNFCAAILDFGLWTVLLASRSRDVRLLLLTGGMGIMFAGDAIGAAARHVGIAKGSWPIFNLGNVITILADSTFLYVWWRAFRVRPAGDARTANAAR